MTLKGGTSQACAACKYQRRRCTSTCQLAPYFPADQPNIFLNAHRLFGVRNMLKILEQLDNTQKDIAMRSIIYQANAREKYPVYGCLGIIQHMYYQIQLVGEEIQAVHAQLAIYKQQQQPNQLFDLSNIHDSLSQLQLGMGPPSSSDHGFTFHHDVSQQFEALRIGTGSSSDHEASYNSNSYNSNSSFLDAKENTNVNSSSSSSSMWLQHHSYNNEDIHFTSQPSTSTTQQQQRTQDYDEMHQFFYTIDDSKELYESSSESSFKDTIQSIEHVDENELKNGAACFSLTSPNFTGDN